MNRGAGAAGSPFLALRFARFRVLVLLQLANAVAVWMHVVAAQWTMTTAGRSATVVAAVPAAMSVPFLVLCLPVGALVGRVPPARMMASATVVSASASVAAGLLAAGAPGAVVPMLLTVVAVGGGLVALAIAWQTQIPRLVDRGAVASAALVDGMTFNLARAAGPLAGGLGLSLVGTPTTFVAAGVVFGLCALGMFLTAPRTLAVAASGESLVRSIAGGLRFSRNSPWTRRLLYRSCLFGIPSAALWALLPLVVHDRLGLGSGGFGLLFGLVGLGAVGGTVALAPVRARLAVNHFGFAGSVMFGVMLAGLALSSRTWVTGLLLVLGGAAWVGVQTTWMTAAHQVLPDWVRPRILALILLAFQGCQALGGLGWGMVADVVGLPGALGGAAALMAVAASGFLRRGLLPSEGIAPEPAAVPVPASIQGVDTGRPLRVEVHYRPSPATLAEFLDALERLRQSRLRLGAGGWELLVDPGCPRTYVEAFPVASWEEYVASETVRLTVPELRLRERVHVLLEEEPRTRVLVHARPLRRS
jgi:hypothetical protein